MGSSFFHERNFEGLLEKVCQEERPESNHRLSDHLCCLLGFSKAKNAEPCQSRCEFACDEMLLAWHFFILSIRFMIIVLDWICSGDTVPICQKAAADDADTSSEETLNHVMDVVKEICQGDMQQKEEGASNEVKTASDTGPLKIRQVFRNSYRLVSVVLFDDVLHSSYCYRSFHSLVFYFQGLYPVKPTVAIAAIFLD